MTQKNAYGTGVKVAEPFVEILTWRSWVSHVHHFQRSEVQGMNWAGRVALHSCSLSHRLSVSRCNMLWCLCVRSWQRHAETKTLFETLRFLSQQDADCVVLENVPGLAQGSSSQSSPLDMIIKEMETLGYRCSIQWVDLALFHQANRPRHRSCTIPHIPCQCQSLGGEDRSVACHFSRVAGKSHRQRGC